MSKKKVIKIEPGLAMAVELLGDEQVDDDKWSEIAEGQRHVTREEQDADAAKEKETPSI